MKSHKGLLLSSLVLLFFFFGNATAQVCFDPNYGYYDCNPVYHYYPDPTQALVEGAFLGIILGGYNNGGYERHGWGHRNWGGHRGWGGHHH